MNWWGFRGVRSTRRRPCLRRLGRNLRRPLPPSLFVVRGFHQRREILVSGAGFRCEEQNTMPARGTPRLGTPFRAAVLVLLFSAAQRGARGLSLDCLPADWAVKGTAGAALANPASGYCLQLTGGAVATTAMWWSPYTFCSNSDFTVTWSLWPAKDATGSFLSAGSAASDGACCALRGRRLA